MSPKNKKKHRNPPKNGTPILWCSSHLKNPSPFMTINLSRLQPIDVGSVASAGTGAGACIRDELALYVDIPRVNHPPYPTIPKPIPSR